MTNATIAAKLEEIADLLEFKKANAFRVRAYRNGARRVKDLADSVAEIVADDSRSLTDLEGIGKDLAEKIADFVDTGTTPLLDELREDIPAGVLRLLRVPGLGPKKAAAVYEELNVASLDQLRAACEEHLVQNLKGFGKKTEEKILAGIDLAAQADKRIYWAEADEVVSLLREHFANQKAVQQFEVAGSYRRGKETVGDLDLLVDADSSNQVMEHFATYPDIDEVIARGETKMSVRLLSGLQVDLRVVPQESFGAALQYFTGSKEHNVVVRRKAKDRGLRVNEWGVFRVDEESDDEGPTSGERVGGMEEADIYKSLELSAIPPELRENRSEFSWAADGAIPELIQSDDIVCDLHMHTTESDGKATLEEMVAAAQERGLKYIAITDHSPRVSMANGLSPERLRKQWSQIDELNKQLDDFLVLKGIECDILEAGGMDLPDDVLAEADWVIASVHYGQNQSKSQITERILGALENPHVCLLAHPTGRLINRREPYEVDLDAVFAAAKKHNKFLEINASPKRLDLNDIHAAAARETGIPISINTDAHSITGLNGMRYGILQARRAALTKGDVINTKSWQEVQKLLGRD